MSANPRMLAAKQKTYPRSLFSDSYCAQAGPTEGASRGVDKRDRRAVAAPGCNTHTQRAAAEAAWSRRHRWRHGLFGGSAVTPCRTGRRCSSPKRWIETSATGGHAEESLKHRARDAGEKADLRFYPTGRRSRPRLPFCSGFARGLGPWVRWTPGVPRPLGLFRERIGRNHSGAKRTARTRSHV